MALLLGGRAIGRENSWQNPVNTIRTCPENLRTPDGGKAYSSWSGSILDVLNAHMSDVNEIAIG